MADLAAVRTTRLTLVVLGPRELSMLIDSPESIGAFRVPPDWPDREALDHIERWNAHAVIDGGASPWRARAVVDATGQMVGHAGFHGPPVSVEEALADPTFVGTISPCNGGVVELGYSIFTQHRRKGYASEAVTGLIGWAFASGAVQCVIATVQDGNEASKGVLARVGGFLPIGICREGGADEVVYRRDK